jgi:hypothetical protein
MPWLATSAVDVAPMNKPRTNQISRLEPTALCVVFYLPFSEASSLMTQMA